MTFIWCSLVSVGVYIFSQYFCNKYYLTFIGKFLNFIHFMFCSLPPSSASVCLFLTQCLSVCLCVSHSLFRDFPVSDKISEFSRLGRIHPWMYIRRVKKGNQSTVPRIKLESRGDISMKWQQVIGKEIRVLCYESRVGSKGHKHEKGHREGSKSFIPWYNVYEAQNEAQTWQWQQESKICRSTGEKKKKKWLWLCVLGE